MQNGTVRPLRDEEIGLLSALQASTTESGSRWSFVAKTVAAMLVGFSLGCAVSWYTRSEEVSSQSTVSTATQTNYPLNFLVIGDWGRNGHYNQTLVAAQMGRIGKELCIEFVMSTGDNFYEAGLTGTEDPKFTQSFTDIYTAPSLQKTWFTVLGNHDYMGDVLAQLGDVLPHRDARWFCRREFQIQCPLCNGETGKCETFVEFFFIDTTPFVNEYWDPTTVRAFDWRGLAPRKEQLQLQLKNLSQALEKSTAAWKIVVGHHTIRSLGKHGGVQELVDQVLPVLEAQKVDLYINGHDHCLQYIKRPDSNVHFITSGAGSKAWQGIQPSRKLDGLQFAYDGQGFVSISMAAKSLRLEFHDGLGNSLHTVQLTKTKLSNSRDSSDI